MQIEPEKLDRNPDNPRLIFREDELNLLLDSIKEVGIQVPVTVYQDADRYTLIDGERRWRCAIKLNLPTIPANIQPKPTPLENLLIMFNIHNVRVQWDLMPMALKLGEIQRLLAEQGRTATPKSLAAVTGASLPTVRRALDLLDLPEKYRRMLLKEAEKPKSEQKITPDLFIEIYKSMRVVDRYVPEVLVETSKREFIEAMVDKYRSNVVDSVVEFRQVSRIARSELAGVDSLHVKPVILRLVMSKKYSIKQAYADTVEIAYRRRDLLRSVQGLLGVLSEAGVRQMLDQELRDALEELRKAIVHMLE